MTALKTCVPTVVPALACVEYRDVEAREQLPCLFSTAAQTIFIVEEEDYQTAGLQEIRSYVELPDGQAIPMNETSTTWVSAAEMTRMKKVIAQNLDSGINDVIHYLSPTWMIGHDQLLEAARQASILARCATSLGFDGFWLLGRCLNILSGECPNLGADDLRARLAGLSVDMGQPRLHTVS
jgi:hypothetical protein